jgi:hypothetical protein
MEAAVRSTRQTGTCVWPGSACIEGINETLAPTHRKVATNSLSDVNINTGLSIIP